MINVLARIRLYWWEKSSKINKHTGTFIQDSIQGAPYVLDHFPSLQEWDAVQNILRTLWYSFLFLLYRSGLGVALRNLAFLEIDVHNNWRPFRPQISFIIDPVTEQSSLEAEKIKRKTRILGFFHL